MGCSKGCGGAVTVARSAKKITEAVTASSPCARLAGVERGGPMRIVEGRVRVAASDVANFLACQELTQLDLRRARGTLRPPHPRDLGFEDLVRRGEEHELGVLERFRADGLEVADLSGAPPGATAEAVLLGE